MLCNANAARQKEATNAKIKLVETNKRINDIENAMVDLFEQKQDNVISYKMFGIISKKYDSELEELLKEKKECDIIISRNNADWAFIVDWMSALERFRLAKIYDIKHLCSIIDAIYVESVGTQERLKIKYKIGFIQSDIFDLRTA